MAATTTNEILFVAFGGAAGCLCRYAAEHIRMFPDQNFNTVVINITGCLLIGILWVVLNRLFSEPALISRLIITGVLGGFTTFSAFSLHPVLMIRDGEYFTALIYVSVSVIGGLAACFGGMWLTEHLIE